VTTTEALAYLLVGPVVATLRQTHPGLQIDLAVGVRSLDVARRESDLAIRFARSAASELVCRKLGEVGLSLCASQRYLAKLGIPTRGHGLGGYDLITFTGAPAAASPFFMGESLNGARVAIRCDNPLIQLKAAANRASRRHLANAITWSARASLFTFPKHTGDKLSIPPHGNVHYRQDPLN
jgi:DNA-binding transcriptional LysR family regulator